MTYLQAFVIALIQGVTELFPVSSRPPAASGLDQAASHRKPASGRAAADIDAAEWSDARIARLSYAAGMLIGATQILAMTTRGLPSASWRRLLPGGRPVTAFAVE